MWQFHGFSFFALVNRKINSICQFEPVTWLYFWKQCDIKIIVSKPFLCGLSLDIWTRIIDFTVGNNQIRRRTSYGYWKYQAASWIFMVNFSFFRFVAKDRHCYFSWGNPLANVPRSFSLPSTKCPRWRSKPSDKLTIFTKCSICKKVVMHSEE